MSVVIISDGEPDDIIAETILIRLLASSGVTSDNIFVLATLRDAKQTACVLNKIIYRYYFDLHVTVGSSGKKPALITDEYKESKIAKLISSEQLLKDNLTPLKNILSSSLSSLKSLDNSLSSLDNSFNNPLTAPDIRSHLVDVIMGYCETRAFIEGDKEKKEEKEEKEEKLAENNGVRKMYEFIESRSQPVDIILLAPPIDLVSPLRNVRSIWSWGGYDRTIAPENRIESFNWRTAPEETKLFLNWVRDSSTTQQTKLFVCTPAIYKNSFGGFGGINEEKNKDITDMIAARHDFIYHFIQHWNSIISPLVKKRCGIKSKDGIYSIQFTPADPIAAVAFLSQTQNRFGFACPEFIKSSSLLDGFGNVYFVDEIDYDKFITHLYNVLK